MKLLDAIVELLSSENGSLTDAMLKTKVVMNKMGHKELGDWLNNEMKGYDAGTDLPSYRVVPVRVVGNLRNSSWSHAAQILPIGHLAETTRKALSTSELRESVHVLEEWISKRDAHIVHPITPSLYPELSKGWSNAHVEYAWVQMEPTQIMGATIEVRTRLLDFVLSLQNELGDAKEDDMKEAAKGIDMPHLFASSMFGDNTTIIVGDSNTATIVNTVTKGNFKSLASTLKTAGVHDTDIAELETAVGEDDAATVVAEKRFGPKVRSWMAKMAGKAVDGVWAIGLSTGGKLLTEALAAHYGIKL
ncbi:hypothetical protein [Burkholderia sp. L27(2015)]|uniref:AbiTii domain-containing protein n=1 Tax=Burkholderia sp. L27(2015) TaxID=1641858 RepID=UPI00131B140B|nr:hypothetical protein [Burkholderia sp. L27(2015)]